MNERHDRSEGREGPQWAGNKTGRVPAREENTIGASVLQRVARDAAFGRIIKAS